VTELALQLLGFLQGQRALPVADWFEFEE